MKKSLLLSMLAAVSMGATAQTDVTSYITNADLSSTEGWTEYVSGSFKDFGNGLIGTYGVRTADGQPVSTVDETHLATEYCFGFECRWEGNYASYNQTTQNLPVGSYTLTFDVENTNSKTTKVAYNNLNYVKVGETTYTDASTEWMNGASSWTTHSITFSVTEAAPAVISFGYGTGSNNIGSANTPTLYVSHVKLTYVDLLAGLKTVWEEAKAAAETALAAEAYANVKGAERTALAAEIAKAEPTTADGYEAASAALKAATESFVAAKPSYDALAEINAVAKAVGAEEAVAANAAQAIELTKSQNVAVYNAIKNGYVYPVSLGAWTTSGASQNNKGQHWDGTSTTTYYEPNQWNSSSVNWGLSQSKALPAGTYVLMATGRRSGSLSMTMSIKNGDAIIGSVNSFPAQDSGKGVDTSGAANFSDEGTYANTNGRGWEWRYIAFTLDAETTLTLDVTATSPETHQWASISDFAILSVAEVNAYKIALSDAIAAAKITANVPVGGLFQKSADDKATFVAAIEAAEAVYANASATDEELAAAKTALDAAVAAFEAAAVAQPDATKAYSFQYVYDGDALYLALNTTDNKVILSATEYKFNFDEAEGGYYLRGDGEDDAFVGLNGNWNMSSAADSKCVITVEVLSNGHYYLKEAKGYIGVDSNTDGASCYSDKKTDTAGEWIIAEKGDLTPTAIQTVTAAAANSDAIYNMAGQQVKSAKKGLYIMNGKKYIVK